MLASRRTVLCITFLTVLAFPLVSQAATRVTVSKADGFVASEVQRVAIVTTECSDVVDCTVIERKAFVEAREMRVEFAIIPAALVKDFLLKQGRTEYAPELREALAAEFNLDGIFEIKIPHAEAGDGAWGRKRSQVKVELLLVRPSGEILLHAVGTSRSNNVITSPETAAGNTVEAIFKRVFK